MIANHCIERASLSLQDFLQRFCSSMGVAYLKISFMNEELQRSFGWPLRYTTRGRGTVEIDLEATPSDFIWSSLFSKNRRWKMKRFEREGYEARQARGNSDLRDFYAVYHDNMKYIGARPYPYHFLENMWSLLYPLNLRIWVVAREKPIGGILVLKDARRTYWLLAGIDRRQAYARYPVVNYLLWKEIETAEEEGYRYVSLGATPSDPDNLYYLQKTSFGGSFEQQEVAYYPCSSTGRVLLQAKAKAVSRWKTIRGFVPIRFRRMVERELQRFY